MRGETVGRRTEKSASKKGRQREKLVLCDDLETLLLGHLLNVISVGHAHKIYDTYPHSTDYCCA